MRTRTQTCNGVGADKIETQSCNTGTSLSSPVLVFLSHLFFSLHAAERDPTCATLIAACPADCLVSSWGTFDTCTKTCGNGTHIRSRTITQSASHGGAACPTLSDVQPCTPHLCPIDCVVGSWVEFGNCSSPCGAGMQTQSRSVIVASANGGMACPPVTQTQSCTAGKRHEQSLVCSGASPFIVPPVYWISK